MGLMLVTRVGLVAGLCGWLVACSDGGGAADTPDVTAGSGGSSSGSAGESSAGTNSTAGTNANAGSSTGGVGTGGTTAGGAGATNGGSGGSAGSAGSAGMGGMPIDANGGAPSGPASGRQTARPSGTMPGTTAGYWEYLPPHYGNGALSPLLVFRHGIGENGTGSAADLQKVTAHGPPKLIKADQWPDTRPFVVLSVQHPGGDCPSSQEIADFFTFALANYAVDPKRVYLTGLSCGAIGGWNYLGDHLDEVVSASVLIAGDARGAFAKQGCKLGTIPIWAFHGDMDPTVPPAEDGVPIASLKQCDPAPIDLTYTVYPGVQHDSWTMTYDLSNPANDIYAWMLTHSKQ